MLGRTCIILQNSYPTIIERITLHNTLYCEYMHIIYEHNALEHLNYATHHNIKTTIYTINTEQYKEHNKNYKPYILHTTYYTN